MKIFVTELITVLIPGAGPPAQSIATASFILSIFLLLKTILPVPNLKCAKLNNFAGNLL
jgi:hypothetical protein